MPLNERSILRVEGRDDKFVIENLLRRHGVDFANVEIKPAEEDEGTGGKDRLLRGMKTTVTTSTGRAVGAAGAGRFVLDADADPERGGKLFDSGSTISTSCYQTRFQTEVS